MELTRRFNHQKTSHRIFLFVLAFLLSNIFPSHLPTQFSKSHKLSATLEEDVHFFKIDLYSKKGELNKLESPLSLVALGSVTPQISIHHSKVAQNWNPDLISHLPDFILIVGSLSPPSSSLES